LANKANGQEMGEGITGLAGKGMPPPSGSHFKQNLFPTKHAAQKNTCNLKKAPPTQGDPWPTFKSKDELMA